MALSVQARARETTHMHMVTSRSAVERLRAALDAGDWPLVSSVIEAGWTELLHRAPVLLSSTLAAVPDEMVEREPRFRLARDYVARMIEGRDPTAAYRARNAAAAPLGAVDRLAALTARISVARTDGRLDEARRLVAAAHALLGEQPVDSHPELASPLPEMHYHWGLALEQAGEFDSALVDHLEGFDWALSTGHRMMQVASGGAIAYLHALHGRIDTARRWLDRLPTSGPDEWWSPAMSTQSRLAASLVREAESGAGPDPLDGMTTGDILPHWAPYFFARAVAVGPGRPARLLRGELDSFLSNVPEVQRRQDVSSDYVALTRTILSVRVQELGALDVEDRPSATAPLLRQLPAAMLAVRLAHAGRHRSAMQLAAPLLDVDGSRPRVLVVALVATALATPDPARRSATLEEAAAVSVAHGYYTSLSALTPELRAEIAGPLRELGAEEAARRLLDSGGDAAADHFAPLTRRERVVVEHAMAGETTAEIAAALLVSVNTVKSQLRTAYRKLGVSSRAELRRLEPGPG